MAFNFNSTLTRALAPQAKDWVFEFQPRQTLIVKTGSDSSTAKCSATVVSVTGPRIRPLKTDASCHSRCDTLKTLTAQWPCVPSIGQDLPPFTGNDDVSK